MRSKYYKKDKSHHTRPFCSQSALRLSSDINQLQKNGKQNNILCYTTSTTLLTKINITIEYNTKFLKTTTTNILSLTIANNNYPTSIPPSTQLTFSQYNNKS